MASLSPIPGGGRWRPTAGELGELFRAARAAGRAPSARPAPSPVGPGPHVVATVRNDSGGFVPRGGVLVASGAAVDPQVNPGGYRHSLAVAGDAPGPTGGRPLVLLDGAPDGQYRTAVVQGLALAQVDVVAEGDATAGLAEGVTSHLVGGLAGVEVLAREKAEEAAPEDRLGVQWCLVLLGGGGGGTATATVVGTVGVLTSAIPAAEKVAWDALSAEEQAALDTTEGVAAALALASPPDVFVYRLAPATVQLASLIRYAELDGGGAEVSVAYYAVPQYQPDGDPEPTDPGPGEPLVAPVALNTVGRPSPDDGLAQFKLVSLAGGGQVRVLDVACGGS